FKWLHHHSQIRYCCPGKQNYNFLNTNVILASQDELRLFIFIKSWLSLFSLFSLARNRSAVFYKKITVNTAPAIEIFTVPDNREAAA
ncbi:TPA: hypothetical protein ACOEAT_004696, partial [Enterobacter ludwigii]